MKRSILAAFLVILSMGFTGAQIIITPDEVPGIGDAVIQAFDDSPDPVIQPGAPGQDTTWDFRALNADNSDTFRFVNPFLTPYGTQFPSANLALSSDSIGGWVYFDKNDNSLLMAGIAIEIDELGEVSSPVTPNEEFLVFPYEYGFQNSETFSYLFQAEVTTPGVDSMKMKRTTYKESEVDAWGSMIVPMGTYDVLRTHETRQNTDTIWAKIPFFGWQVFSIDESSEERYIWWSDDPAVRYILANLNIDPVSGEVTGAEFMAAPLPVGIREQELKTPVVVYPNPVADHLQVRNQTEEALEFLLTDISGRTQVNGTLSPLKNHTLETGHLAPGLYLIHFHHNGLKYGVKIIHQ